MLEIVGLTGKDKLLPRQLSGGMQQRVSFARALVSEPDIVFMDEPFSALDEMRRTELGRLVFDLWNNSGITFIMNTHSVEDACMLSSKVWIMAAGQRGNGSRLQVINTWMKGESLEFRKSSNRVGIVRDLVVRGMAVSAA
jgi:ABC-type nitrate/sulfonate/bicarbonate transport system ATPase subunit